MTGLFLITAMEGPGLPSRVLLADPHECRDCARMTIFFVNRWGETRCVACDIKAEKERLEVN